MRAIKEIGEEIVRKYSYLQKRQEDILAAFLPLKQRGLRKRLLPSELLRSFFMRVKMQKAALIRASPDTMEEDENISSQ